MIVARRHRQRRAAAVVSRSIDRYLDDDGLARVECREVDLADRRRREWRLLEVREMARGPLRAGGRARRRRERRETGVDRRRDLRPRPRRHVLERSTQLDNAQRQHEGGEGRSINRERKRWVTGASSRVISSSLRHALRPPFRWHDSSEKMFGPAVGHPSVATD